MRIFRQGMPKGSSAPRWVSSGLILAIGLTTPLAIPLLAKPIHVILIPGTSPKYLAPNFPTGMKDVHPALSDWSPHEGRPASRDARNTGDALVDLIKSRSPLGSDVKVSVFAMGASGENTTWIGENSPEARRIAASELAAKLNQISPDEPVILIGHSHADTVATLAANQSVRPVDLKISLNSPGVISPEEGKIVSAVNFYNSKDNVAAQAGESDLMLHGPSDSPNRVMNPGGFVANVETGSKLVLDASGRWINPPTLLGIEDHSYNTLPQVIDQEISPVLGKVLAAQAAEKESSNPGGLAIPMELPEPRTESAGDALQKAGEAFLGRDRQTVNLPSGSNPFKLQDQGLDGITRSPEARVVISGPKSQTPGGSLRRAQGRSGLKMSLGDSNEAGKAPPDRTRIPLQGSDESVRIPTTASVQDYLAWEREILESSFKKKKIAAAGAEVEVCHRA